jgi:hypothetical protein
MAILGRHRVVVGAIADERDRAEAYGLFIAGLEVNTGQRQKNRAVPLEPLADGLSMAAQPNFSANR